jgi:hypothetical protein
MPTTASVTFNAANRLDPIFNYEDATQTSVALATGTYAKGTVLGEVAATPGTYGAYAAAGTGGLNTARALLVYGCTVAANGDITLMGEFGQVRRTVPVFIGGGAFYKTSELVGLDAAAVTQLGGSLTEGTVTAGILRF